MTTVRTRFLQIALLVALSCIAHQASAFFQCSTIISHEESQCFNSMVPCNNPLPCIYQGQPCNGCTQSHARSYCIEAVTKKCVELTINCPENTQGCGYEVTGTCNNVGGAWICDQGVTSNPCPTTFKHCG